MKNELINMNKNGIFYKIKIFFTNIFNKLLKNKKEIKDTYNNNNISINVFREEIKEQNLKKIENPIEKGKLIKELIENKEKLFLLSTERLEKIIEYNDNVIKKNEEIIKKLKMNSPY